MKTVVLGAYGYTGQLVSQVLTNLGIRHAVAGKNAIKLNNLGVEDIEVIDIMNPTNVKDLVRRYDIFVNCIGPFSEWAGVLLEQVVQHQKNYLDLSGESVFVQTSHAKYHKLAQKNKALILHACAFESVLADLMAGRLDLENIEEINTYYFMGRAKPSPGTRLTMKLSRFNKAYFYENNTPKKTSEIKQQPVDFKGFTDYVAIAYPLPEINFFRWTTQAKTIGSYLLADKAEAKYLLPRDDDPTTKKEVIDAYLARKPKGPTPAQRNRQNYKIILEAKNKQETQTIHLKGRDMYKMTAKIVGFFVQKIKEQPQKYGVLSPGQFLDSRHNFFDYFDLNLIKH